MVSVCLAHEASWGTQMESNHMNSIHTSRTKEKPKPQLKKKERKIQQQLYKEQQQKRLLSEPPENQNKRGSKPVNYTFTIYRLCCID